MCDVSVILFVFFFKQNTAYEMRISDWSSDVCSSDLRNRTANQLRPVRKPVARNSASQDRLGGSVNKRRFGLLFRLGGRGRQGIRASVAFGISADRKSVV